MLKKFLRKKTETHLIAPLTGNVITLEEVPDPVFSQKMMGEGIAIMPKEGKVVSPVNGRVIQIPESKHAIGLKTESGLEILIHVGLETVSLKGNGFNVLVKEGDRISVGDSLMKLDLNYIRENAKDIITPIVITNSKDLDQTFVHTAQTDCVAGETSLLSFH